MSRIAQLARNIMSYKNDLSFKFLPNEEIEEILDHAAAEKFIIAAAYDAETDDLVCCRGDGVFVVLQASFVNNPHCNSKRDLTDVRPGDWGNSLCLGEYEAASDFILQHKNAVIHS